MMGELGLDGYLYPIKGVLAMAMQAKEEGFLAILLPSANKVEAAMVDDLPVFGFDHLLEVIAFLKDPLHSSPELSKNNKTNMGFSKIHGNFISSHP